MIQLNAGFDRGLWHDLVLLFQTFYSVRANCAACSVNKSNKNKLSDEFPAESFLDPGYKTYLSLFHDPTDKQTNKPERET